MKNFSIIISNLDSILTFNNVKEICINTEGQLDCGNLFSTDVAFGLDGTIKKFNLKNKGGNTLDFYNEISEVTIKIKNLQYMFNTLLEEIYKEKNEYENEVSEIKNKLSEVTYKQRVLDNEVNKLTEKYKKSRGKNRLDLESELCNKKIEQINENEKEYALEEKIEQIKNIYISKLEKYLKDNIEIYTTKKFL